MRKTVFTKVDYDLDTLVKYISLGEIGLPDIQRPFVWKNSKVRDLFDSMYKGYPVGYLLFWQNTLVEPKRTIGFEQKQKPPRLVIVDGQQRLTSLYAVIKNIPVIRENFESERIKIAFNPLEETFEVADAAIRRDKAYLPDISILWGDNARITHIIPEYLENLRTIREINDDDESIVEDRIQKLQELKTFPFTALELASDVDEEAVSEVFVRINSKGTPLNQADFILTLMSVFWDEGRTALEKFSRDSRKPSIKTASPFNHFIEPYPDHLLRVGVGVAFKRARLKYVYSILRGKDLETEKFSDERREQQFELLKDAQNRVLDLQHWHDFMNCIRQAGFRSNKMISSQNNLLFSYMLYLIGRTEYKVPEFNLRQIIARWFFMSSVTGRFTGSPETAMEFDLARLRDVKDADEFIEALSNICGIAMTGDFWIISLPNDLATSSPRSPSLFAYQAALVLLEARALFSKTKVADLLDPSVHANRAAVERHHLFPKGYLKKIGIDSIRDTNQIANYALVEWGDNSNIISDQAPNEYLSKMKERFRNQELVDMYYWHALPDGWENMEYQEFLRRRRELMAGVIRDAYLKLAGESNEEAQTQSVPVEQLINNGEAVTVEFKSTLRINLHTKEKDPRIELSVLKTIAAFVNSSGGTLIIGVADDGTPVGLEADCFASEDKMYLHLVNLISSRLGPHHMIYIHPRFDEYQDARVMVIECLRGKSPVFVKDGSNERFYARTGAATTELSGSQMQDFINQRFGI